MSEVAINVPYISITALLGLASFLNTQDISSFTVICSLNESARLTKSNQPSLKVVDAHITLLVWKQESESRFATKNISNA